METSTSTEMALFWDRLNEQIKLSGTTQRKLATSCGFTERRIEGLSFRNCAPDAFEICRIAKVLNTTVEYLVTGDDTNPVAQENRELKERIQKAKEALG